ncbi:hypothetical protein BB8028_0002g04810 [Beauveria bassiana]|uniref:Nephrocystin 3-like N-terminal domain-containing protein n=1 Tax=Beauveria bassiana TaxID=176275 RepID=A0A2S7Y1W5_BEABA|nr:hypothetical protein BB8028_0002g04810 [Beauveria bassiana]
MIMGKRALLDVTVDEDDHEQRQLSNKANVVGWICALETEYVAAQVFLDEKHAPPESVATNDNNDYTLGRIGKHNTVIAVLPGGEYGTAAAATVARDMLHSFTNVRIGLMVGIGGGAPNAKHDIRLGDVVVSVPQNGLGGVLQYDFGKEIQDQPFHVTRCLAPPPPVLLTAVSGLRSVYKINGHDIQNDIRTRLAENKRLRREFSRPDAATDRLYHSHVIHPVSDGECMTSCGTDEALMVQRVARDQDDDDDPTVHYGLIASANRLMKNAELRDQYANERDILCFEMEAGGLNSHFPCLVICGICNYADTHKNKKWQGYAAMTAAAYAKDLLRGIPANKLEAEKELSKQVEHVQASVQSLHTSSHLDKITNWISAPDPSTDLNKARQLHQPGTGQWLLLSEQYQLWKTARNSFLWLYGIPGCGKTVLSSTAITDLCDDEETSPNLLYFYFNFADVEKRSTEKAVRSLIQKLRGSLTNIHLLVTSRPVHGIQSCIETWACAEEMTSLQSDLVAHDIKAYIETQVQQIKRWQAKPDVQRLIATTLRDGANGMFRWVYCQFETIEKCLSLDELRRALASLPPTLDATYARILKRLYPEHKSRAVRLLQLLVYSERPLRLDEAVDALAVEPTSEARFDPANRMPMPQEIVQYCAGLVSLTVRCSKSKLRYATEIALAHFSVKEYLLSDRLKPSMGEQLNKRTATAALVELCVSYLLSLESPVLPDRVGELYPFARYSAQYWSHYASVVEKCPSSNHDVLATVWEFYACQGASLAVRL